MDEPCSALDPIATAKIEELIDELRKNYTIVIVTHSMQQAARVSQHTAFFHLGNLVEEGPTEAIFTNPQGPAHAGLHHRPLRLIAERRRITLARDCLQGAFTHPICNRARTEGSNHVRRRRT